MSEKKVSFFCGGEKLHLVDIRGAMVQAEKNQQKLREIARKSKQAVSNQRKKQ